MAPDENQFDTTGLEEEHAHRFQGKKKKKKRKKSIIKQGSKSRVKEGKLVRQEARSRQKNKSWKVSYAL